MVGFDPKTPRQKIFLYYFYLKLFIGRGVSYTGTITGIASTYFLFSLWIKFFFKITDNLFIYSLGIILFLAVILIGYIDVKHGIINEETSFNNRFNPELKHLVKKAKGKVEL